MKQNKPITVIVVINIKLLLESSSLKLLRKCKDHTSTSQNHQSIIEPISISRSHRSLNFFCSSCFYCAEKINVKIFDFKQIPIGKKRIEFFFFVFEHFVKWQIWANHSHASRKKNILFFHHICDFFPFFSALSHYTLYSFNLIFCNICHNSFALYLFLFLILPSFFWQIVVSRKKNSKKKK